MHPSYEIDFARDRPEAVRRIPKSTARINWEALDLVIETTRGSRLEKSLFGRRFKKAIRAHGIEAMTPWFRYHYVSARLALGDFSDYWGWEFRGLTAEDDSEALAARVFWENTWMRKWGGQPVNRLLVIGEQGIGDVIYAASIIPEALVRAREVIFECDERLHTLFERSFPRLKCRKDTTFDDERLEYGKIDAFIMSMDLMRMFRRDRKHFPGKPYLKPDQKRLPEMEKYRNRVGVAWQARQGSLDPMKLDLAHPLSLQYKHFHREIEQPNVDLWHDLEGITALCSVLEKVVCVPTTIHHIAGALGVKTEIIVPEKRSDEVAGTLRWDYSVGKMPWYPDANVFQTINEWRRSSIRSSTGSDACVEARASV